ncbi:hypothetical protein J6TS7_62590 [Paenibacillus dendritiformis]|nr:hypothetical protein J6TS7_62590 [Paenibacillus dendritiformis]
MPEIIDEGTPLIRVDMMLSDNDLLVRMHLNRLRLDDGERQRAVRNPNMADLSLDLKRTLRNSS